MAGTIPISLQQQFDAQTGELLSGGKLYTFQSGTTTPQSAYLNAALSTAYPNPITLESDGRVPFLFFADGTIRARLTDSGGVVQFDTDNIPVVGSSGGGGIDTTDPNAIASTGDTKWRIYSGALAGWVRLNDRTIGSATSGATERANADTQPLFEWLWNNLSDTLAPVSGGRGASAAADFSANKTIRLPNMRGKGPFGLDGMGNSLALTVTAATIDTGAPDTAGSTGGQERITLVTSEMPAHGHTLTDPGHIHSVPFTVAGGNIGAGGTQYMTTIGGPSSNNLTSNTTGITMSNTGGGSAHKNMPPFVLGTWYIKL